MAGSRNERSAGLGLLVVFVALMCGARGASADDWILISSPGLCSYEYDRTHDRTTTTCEASATIMNRRTSDIIRCSARISGDQTLAPSVPERAPEFVQCQSVNSVFNEDGDYGITNLDDNAIFDDTKIRRRGSYAWANAFWVYTRSGAFEIALCANRKQIQNPDFGQWCSTRVEWPNEPKPFRGLLALALPTFGRYNVKSRKCKSACNTNRN